MRNNNKAYDTIRRFTAGTPPNERFRRHYESNKPFHHINGVQYKVVDVSRTAGTTTDEFFLRIVG